MAKFYHVVRLGRAPKRSRDGRGASGGTLVFRAHGRRWSVRAALSELSGAGCVKPVRMLPGSTDTAEAGQGLTLVAS